MVEQTMDPVGWLRKQLEEAECAEVDDGPHRIQGAGLGGLQFAGHLVGDSLGSVRIEVPRDREGTFEAELVPEGVNRLGAGRGR